MGLPTQISTFYTFMRALFFCIPYPVRLIFVVVFGLFTLFGITKNTR